MGQGLREVGYGEGTNILIERRYAEGKLERLPGLAAELVGLRVDLIVSVATAATQAAQKATGTIPIVMVAVGDPVGSGIVASLARPGGNITGVSLFAGREIFGKRLELLKEAAPTVARVAVLWNPINPGTPLAFTELRAPARALGVTLLSLEARGPQEPQRALAAMPREHADALLVMEDPLTLTYLRDIVAVAEKNRMPAVYGSRNYVDAGGLMAYATNFADLYRRAAVYVDKILKGAKPADLPVEQPTKFELVINLTTAKALGLTLPQSLLLRADEVIR